MASKPFYARSTILIIAIMLFIAQISTAQYSRRRSGIENSWEIGFSGGVSRFLNTLNSNAGDLPKKFNYWNSDLNPAITLSVIKNFSPKFSSEIEWLNTKLSGTWNPNNGYPIPPLAIKYGLPYPNPFKTGINQFNLMLIANLNQIIVPNNFNEKWNLFIKVGGGLAVLKEFSALYPYDSGQKPKYTIIYGGGLSYAINEKIKLKLGATWYTVMTDRLDGIHNLKNGGDYTVDEGYSYHNKEVYIYPYIGLTYGFGQVMSKAHFMQRRNSMSLWFKPTTHKYKRRR